MRFRSLGRASLLFLLAAGGVAAHALPGEADAVLRQCGEPQARSQEVSPVTGKPQRDLIYPNLTLHFEPEEGGWSFTTGWQGHLPVTRARVEEEMPCFRTAMEQVAAAPRPVIDPTIATQTVGTSPMVVSTWGVPKLWLIVLLVVLLGIVFLFPRRRPRPAAVVLPQEDRPFRRPTLRSRIRRRLHPPDSPVL